MNTKLSIDTKKFRVSTPLYKQFIESGVSVEDVCTSCGGEFGIHNCHTMQCPKDGIDFPYDKIIAGEKAEWEEITFEPVANEMYRRSFNAA